MNQVFLMQLLKNKVDDKNLFVDKVKSASLGIDFSQVLFSFTNKGKSKTLNLTQNTTKSVSSNAKKNLVQNPQTIPKITKSKPTNELNGESKKIAVGEEKIKFSDLPDKSPPAEKVKVNDTKGLEKTSAETKAVENKQVVAEVSKSDNADKTSDSTNAVDSDTKNANPKMAENKVMKVEDKVSGKVEDKESIADVKTLNVDNEEKIGELLNQLIAEIFVLQKVVGNLLQNQNEKNQTGKNSDVISDLVAEISKMLCEVKAELEQLTQNIPDGNLKAEIQKALGQLQSAELKQALPVEEVVVADDKNKFSVKEILPPEEKTAEIKITLVETKIGSAIPKTHNLKADDFFKQISSLLEDVNGAIKEIKLLPVNANKEIVVSAEDKVQVNNVSEKLVNQLQLLEDKIKLVAENLKQVQDVTSQKPVQEKNGMLEISANKTVNEIKIKLDSSSEKPPILNSPEKINTSNLPLLEENEKQKFLKFLTASFENAANEVKTATPSDAYLKEQMMLNFIPKDKEAVSVFLQNIQNVLQTSGAKVVMATSSQSEGKNENFLDLQSNANNSFLLSQKEPVNSQSVSTDFENLVSAKTVSAENIVENVVKTANLVLGKGFGEMKIKLKPESLGEMTLKVMLDEGIVKATISAQSQKVMQVLENNISLLEDRLRNQGIKFDQIVVQHNSAGQDFNFYQQQTATNQQNQLSPKVNYYGKEENTKDGFNPTKATSNVIEISNINFLA